jgi:DNA invertase Pin-like site-specific DNA recombinase
MGQGHQMNNSITLGYVRTSTTDQKNSLAEQERKLLAAGATEIFVEEKSGGSVKNRPQLQAMLAKLRDGDRVISTRVDRISRSTSDFLAVSALIGEAGAHLSFTDQAIETETPAGRMMLQLLSVFAEFERETIRERVQSGVDRAKREGKQLGRPVKDHAADPKVQGLLTLVSAGSTVTAAAKTVGVSRSTAKRWIAATNA